MLIAVACEGADDTSGVDCMCVGEDSPRGLPVDPVRVSM